MISLGFFHKADLDGHCSGAILKYNIPNIELFGIDHGDDFPWEKLKHVDKVYMVDFALPIEGMIKLSEKLDSIGAELMWIDHHKSVMEDYEKNKNRFSHEIEGVRAIGRAACELTWEYFNPGSEVPRAVELLGRYDTWRNEDAEEWATKVVPFEYGMLSFETNPMRDMKIWEDIFSNKLFGGITSRFLTEKYYVMIGNHISRYLSIQNEKNAMRGAYLVDIEGIRGIAINSETHSSRVLESVYKPAIHDVMVVYSHTIDQKWYVSLYSTKDNVDCSALASSIAAQQKGIGGGHKGAAGMTVEKLPFKIIKEK